MPRSKSKTPPQPAPSPPAPTGPPKASSHSLRNWVLALVVPVLVVYAKVWGYDFLVWDDNLYINENESIRGLAWANWKAFFTEFYVGNYQPLTILTYALEYALVGENGWLFHGTNVLLHAANTVLVYLVVRQWTPAASLVPMWTAFFFGIHPMHVESVAWVSERKDVLYTFFFLGSLLFYGRYLLVSTTKPLVYAFGCFVLACMSKSAAVVLPLVLWLLDDYHNRKPTVRMFIEKIPFLAVSMVFGLVALESQRAAMPETQLVGMGDKILIAAHSLWLYVIKAVFPMGLSAFYPYPPELGKGLPAVYFLAALGVLLMLGLLWYSRRWSKTYFMGMGFFGITIALVLQVVTVGNATMADRYTYVPYIGLFFVLGTIWENYRNRSAQGNRLVWNGVAVLALAIMALLAFRRVDVWKDDEALFTDVLDKYPEAQLAYNNRGCCYLRLANVASRKEEFYNKEYLAKAFQDFDRLVQINDQYRSAYHNRGLVRFYLKDYNGAVEDYTRAMAKDTSNKGIYFDRATSRSEIGDHVGALQDFDTAIEYRIRLAESFFNRGNTRRKLNDFQGALADYNRAIEAQEDFLEAIQNRSLLHMVLRDYPSALKDLDRILELKPDDQVTVQNRRVIQALVDSIAGKAT